VPACTAHPAHAGFLETSLNIEASLRGNSREFANQQQINECDMEPESNLFLSFFLQKYK